MELFHTHIATPIGTVRITGNNRGVRSVTLVNGAQEDTDIPEFLLPCAHALRSYFQGEKHPFGNLSLAMIGTDFQLRVWEELLNIPYGDMGTYGEVAENIGEPKAARAVGTALNKNPLLIVVPCHRVVPQGGTRDACGEYACGVETKRWLLRHEAS